MVCFSVAVCADDWIIIFFFYIEFAGWVIGFAVVVSFTHDLRALNVCVCWMRHLSLIWTKIRLKPMRRYTSIECNVITSIYGRSYDTRLCVWIVAGRWFSGAWFQWILKRNSSIIGLWRYRNTHGKQQRSQLSRGLNLNTSTNLPKINPIASLRGRNAKIYSLTNDKLCNIYILLAQSHFQRSLTCLAMHMVANVHAPLQQ